jgi:pimeloyl-ACP methyl ester carboxylesterase
MPVKPGCSVILIHGIGDQPEDWSKKFRKALKTELGISFKKVKLDDAYWAPLSTWQELVHPTLAASPEAAGVALEADVFNRTVQQVASVMAAEEGIPPTSLGFGPVDIKNWLLKLPKGIKNLVEDIGNYVARNGVRTAVQNVLHSKLGDAERLKVPVMLIGHSQGTVICYDALRQAGGNYAHLRTWITMGSPLRKYYLSCLQWGKQKLGMPSTLRWLNLYDAKDIVGNDLNGAVSWQSPIPEDIQVDNVNNAGGAHNHWDNPEVVQIVADEIRKLLV